MTPAVIAFVAFVIVTFGAGVKVEFGAQVNCIGDCDISIEESRCYEDQENINQCPCKEDVEA